MNKIRFVVVDDHPSFRDGLARMLAEKDDFECVGKATDGAEAIAMVKESKPDIVLMDIVLPRSNGIKTTKEIHRQFPKTAIIILSAFDYDAYILSSLRNGARGYILKTAPLDKIVNTMRLVSRGESVLDTKVTDKLVNHIQLKDAGEGFANRKIGFDMLNPRELEVISLAAKGMSNKEIADVLVISERTVQTHLVNIFRKLGANSRTQAVLYALKEGWIELDETRQKRDI